MRFALQVALIALVACAAGELLHARRTARVAHLAFGPSGRPRTWARFAPFARVLAAAALAFGLAVLWRLAPKSADGEVDPDEEPSQHLLVCLDVSPSMYLADAGPNRDQSRWQRASEVLEGVMSRIDMDVTRVTVIAFYTGALPVVIEAFDMAVVRNVLDGLPLDHAFDVGQTKLQEGVEAALEFAKPWPKGSAALIVVSDGDTISAGPIGTPPRSIADALVLGVGDPHRGTPIAGRTSRQDAKSLKQLATRLQGIYHDANQHHLPSAIVSTLGMSVPSLDDPSPLRDAALALTLGGASVLALLPLFLALFGRAALPRGARRDIFTFSPGAGGVTNVDNAAGARAPARPAQTILETIP